MTTSCELRCTRERAIALLSLALVMPESAASNYFPQMRAAQEKVSTMLTANTSTPLNSSIPEIGECLPCKGLNTFVGKRLRADTQSAARLQQQQTEKHQALAEDE